MKPVLCCIALLSLVTFSCKKDKTKPKNAFVGRWDMVWVTGGIAGIHMTPKEFGHTKSYTFYIDSTCTIMEDSVIANTVYSTNIGTPYYYHLGTKYMIFRNTGTVYEYSFAHDTLKFYPAGLMDGFTEWYVKQE